MISKNGNHTEKIAYGKGEVEIKIPEANYMATLMPKYRPGIKDEAKEIKKALANPIGTGKLREIARGEKNDA